MKILSIETSCDDTAISIMEATGSITGASFKVLGHTSNSQIKIHIPYGGVYPMLAKREHIKNLPILLEEVLKQAKLDKKDKPVDAIAVTYGPGLEPALWTGITFAQELSKKWNLPVIPVNHMEGHILSVFGKAKGTFKIPIGNDKKKFPVLSLLVSGGHTQLVLVKKWGDYEIIGETLDDAVGEAFDKVGRMLELPYPGGPEISKLAEEVRGKEKKNIIKLPRPMLHTKDYNFSFSGLKTAVLYLIRDLKKENPNILQNDKMKAQIALEFENAAIECLIHKTGKAIEKYKIRTLIVGGGVAANKHLRNEMKKVANTKGKQKITLLFPAKELSGDNSLMIGMAGYLQYLKKKGKFGKATSIKAAGNLRL